MGDSSVVRSEKAKNFAASAYPPAYYYNKIISYDDNRHESVNRWIAASPPPTSTPQLATHCIFFDFFNDQFFYSSTTNDAQNPTNQQCRAAGATVAFSCNLQHKPSRQEFFSFRSSHDLPANERDFILFFYFLKSTAITNYNSDEPLPSPNINTYVTSKAVLSRFSYQRAPYISRQRIFFIFFTSNYTNLSPAFETAFHMRPPTPSRISEGDTSLGPTNRITMSTALLPSVPRLARFVFPPLLLDALRLLDAATVPRVDSPHSPRVSPYICEGEPCHNSEGGPATPFFFCISDTNACLRGCVDLPEIRYLTFGIAGRRTDGIAG